MAQIYKLLFAGPVGAGKTTAVQTLSDIEKGKRLVRLAARELTDQRTVAWLIEAALRYQGKAMALATLQSTAALYPFLLGQPLAYVVANSDALELRSEGPSQQFVALHAAI